MRRLLMFVAAILFSFSVNAQAGFFKSANSLSVDTLTNAGTKYLTVKPVGAAYPYCSASFTLINISGTSAATVTLEHSADGINFYSVPVDSVVTISGAGTKGINWSGYRDNSIRLKFVGSGTQSTKIQGYYSMRK